MRLLFLAALEERRMFSPRASASSSLVHKNGHYCGHVREGRLFVPPSHFEVPPMLSDTGFVRGAIESRVPVRPMVRSSISVLMSRSTHCGQQHART